MALRATHEKMLSSPASVPVMEWTCVWLELRSGVAGDRRSIRAGRLLLFRAQGASWLVLAQAAGYLGALAFALLWGFGCGGRTPMLHAMRGSYFGRRHFGVILGMSAFPMALGMMAAPVIVGRVFDTTGTYRTALFFLAAACLVAAMTITFPTRPQTPGPSRHRVARETPPPSRPGISH